MLLPLIAGAFAGAVHAVSGPDHLAAVVPLAMRDRRAWRTGVRWGMGHALGVAVVGLLALLLREALPLDRIASWGERFVGLGLVGIGIGSIRSALRLTGRVHLHEHEHDGVRHVHVHVHAGGKAHGSPAAHRHAHAAFGLGTLHGVAGSSHLFGVLPALALPTRIAAATYLGGFGVASIGVMGILAAVVGRVSGGHGLRFHRRALFTAGAGALAVGAFWLAS
jgi:hypothetical protein